MLNISITNQYVKQRVTLVWVWCHCTRDICIVFI